MTMVLGPLLSVLAALLPALLLYFGNLADIPFSSVLPVFGALAGIGLLVWLILRLATRRRWLAAAVSALSLLVLLNAGRLIPAEGAPEWLTSWVVCAAALVLLAVAGIGLSRLREALLRDVVIVLSLALAAFLLSSGIPAFIRYAQEKSRPETAAAEEIDITPAAEADRPNIYWIITDEYAGLEELQKYYHYDNTPFYDTLRSMGFTVSQNSWNWQSSTYVILGDILRMGYGQSDEEADRKLVADPEAPLWQLLRRLGYQLYEAESAAKFGLPDRVGKHFSVYIPETAQGDTVVSLLLRSSILFTWEEEIASALLPKQAKLSVKERVLNVFDWAENPESVRGDQRTFTAVYIRYPHSPYDVNEFGKSVPRKQRKDVMNKELYLGQLLFTTRHLEQVCRSLVSADPDSIIILQSDHGQRHVANVTYLDTTNILNAVYFRGKPLEGIEGVNGMNTWFTVLRTQFGLQIPPAEEIRFSTDLREDCIRPEEENPNAE